MPHASAFPLAFCLRGLRRPRRLRDLAVINCEPNPLENRWAGSGAGLTSAGATFGGSSCVRVHLADGCWSVRRVGCTTTKPCERGKCLLLQSTMLDFDVQHEFTSILSSSCLTRAGNNVSGLILFLASRTRTSNRQAADKICAISGTGGQLPVTAQKLRQTPRAKQDPGG